MGTAVAGAPAAYSERSPISGLELALAFVVTVDRAADVALCAGCCNTAPGALEGEAQVTAAPPPVLCACGAALLRARRQWRGWWLRKHEWQVGVRGVRAW
jgi:hypothetical protein